MAMGRNIVALAASVVVGGITHGYARDWYPDETSMPAAIEFSVQPSGGGSVKQFAGTELAFRGKPTAFNKDDPTVLGRILNPRITLTNKPDGSVPMTFEYISMSGDRGRGQNGYFTGDAQRTMIGQNLGGVAWRVTLYDGTPNATPIYTWDSETDTGRRQEIQCGVSEPRSFSLTIRPGGPLSPSEIFNRLTKIRAVALPARWTHC